MDYALVETAFYFNSVKLYVPSNRELSGISNLLLISLYSVVGATIINSPGLVTYYYCFSPLIISVSFVVFILFAW